MNIYDHLADRYSRLFPLESKQTEFILSFIERPPSTVLDVGCATGDLSFSLCKEGYSVTGIDINEKMISIAKKKARTMHSDIVFMVHNMLNIKTLDFFHTILSFGNTLTHLDSIDEVARFFKMAFSNLYDRGYFIFQILNFDKIAFEGKVDFPVIENEEFVFDRKYDLRDKNRYLFEIQFVDKKEGRVFTGEEPLLPLKQKSIVELLKESGFAHIAVYSDYDRTRSDLSEFASIYVAKK